MYTPLAGSKADPKKDSQTPDLRKPSQAYVSNYIARRVEPPVSSPCTSSAMTPASSPRGRAKRIFYQLEETCPAHYYPKLKEVDPHTMLLMRRALLLMCVLQLIFATGILYSTYFLGLQHDPLNELFTYVFISLCVLASGIGLVGTCFNSRAMLLFFYINQLCAPLMLPALPHLHSSCAASNGTDRAHRHASLPTLQTSHPQPHHITPTNPHPLLQVGTLKRWYLLCDGRREQRAKLHSMPSVRVRRPNASAA